MRVSHFAAVEQTQADIMPFSGLGLGWFGVGGGREGVGGKPRWPQGEETFGYGGR